MIRRSSILFCALSMTVPGDLCWADSEEGNATELAQDQWTHAMFESLFPEPGSGWTVSEVRVKEIETVGSVAQGFFGLASGVAGIEAPAPVTGYRLTRTYHSDKGSIEVEIVSENFDLAVIVLAIHGFTELSKDGKPIKPVSEEARIAKQRELLKAGFQPAEFGNHLGTKVSRPPDWGVFILLENYGIAGIGCDYENCFADIDALISRTNFAQLTEFAVFDHRKPN